jgi:Icc-related predicted phosphoesterase
MAMRISYVSDIHLEFLNYPDFSKEEGGDILILAGDILCARYLRKSRTDHESRSIKKYLIQKFKPHLLDKYRHVLYVPGNHEYYGSMYNDTIPTIVNWLNENNFDNVFVMNNNHYVYRDIVFVGCTLWSDFMKGDYHVMNVCQRGMSDYRVIGLTNTTGEVLFNKATTPINAQFVLGRHEFSRNYIDTTAKMFHDKNVVVVTHMAPTFKSLNKDHSGNDLDGAYASDISGLILDNPNIKFWVHGHTHMNVDYEVGTCKVLSNQRGYPFEFCNVHFPGIQHFEV